jgi:DNA-binding beta-propeller fold protein YncE
MKFSRKITVCILAVLLLGIGVFPFARAADPVWTTISLPQQPGQFFHPRGATADSAGNLYIADTEDNRIVRRDTQGNWTVVASLGNAPGQVNNPFGLKIDGAGNLYVADYGNNRVQVRDSQGNWTVLGSYGDVPGTFQLPTGVNVDGAGNLYVADYGKNEIQMRDSQGNWSIVASNGANPGQVSAPYDLAFDAAGNLYVTEWGNSRVQRRDTQGNWTVIGPTGSQPGQFADPSGVVVDAAGNVYVSENSNHRIERYDSQGQWTVLASLGSNPGEVHYPFGLAVDGSGNLFVAEYGNNRVQERDANGNWTVLGRMGTAPGQVYQAYDVATDAARNLYVADTNNNRIQRRTPQGVWTILATEGTGVGQVLQPTGVATDAAGNLYVAEELNNRIQRRDPQGNWTVLATVGLSPGSVSQPTQLTVDGAGNLYVSEEGSGNDRVQMRDPQGNWTVLATVGDATGQVLRPHGLAVDGAGNLYVADWSNTGRIQRRDSQGNWSVIATFGPLPSGVYTPFGLALNPAGDLYVGDFGHSAVQKRDAQGNWTVLNLGYGSHDGEFIYPFGVALDSLGNLYAADYANSRIQEFSSNHPPVAEDQTINTAFDTAAPVTLTATDPENDSLTYSTTNPSHGTLTGTAPDLTYTPTPGFSGLDSFSFTANDGQLDSNTATVSINVAPDASQPGTLVSLSPATPNGLNGWYQSDVTITLTATDNSGSATVHYLVDGVEQQTASNSLVVTYNTEGTHQIGYFASDSAGNTEPIHNFTLKLDKSDPTVTFDPPTTSPNANGWYNAPVTIPFTVGDAVSGIASVVPASPLVLNGEGSSTTQVVTANDNAGRSASASPTPVKIDRTPPTITASATSRGNAYTSGSWTSQDVIVTFSCVDTLSGVSSFTSPVTVSSEGANQSAPGTCTDNAGNSASFTFTGINIDHAAPTISASATSGGVAYTSGAWTHQDVIVTFSCTDTVSGVASFTPPQTLSAEGADQSSTGTCTNNAGTSASVTFPGINIDKSDPTVTFDVPSPAPNGNGWNNTDVTISFTANDALAGIASVIPNGPVVLSTEGSAVNGNVTATDRAGNSNVFISPSVKIDRTPPTLTTTAVSGGDAYTSGAWTSQDVTVTFDCSDGGSGVASVTSPVTISTEGANQSATGTCTDNAANSSSFTFSGINIDRTQPTITDSATSGGSAYTSGTWTHQDVIVTFSCTDAGSGVASVTPPQTISTEGADQSVTGNCTDKTGNTVSLAFSGINLDKAIPTVTFAAPSPAPNANGWNNTDVTIPFTASDALSGVASVVPVSPLVLNTEGDAVSGNVTATDNAGNSTAFISPTVKIDKTSPTITASATSGGSAYTAGTLTGQEVVVTFACSDSGSGVASVTAPITVSAEGANQSATGTCTDNAGNSASFTFSGINLSRAAPTLTATAASGGAAYSGGAWTNKEVVVTFACSDANFGVSSVTSPVTVSSEGENQSVTGTCVNTVGKSVSFTFSGINIDKTQPAMTTHATTSLGLSYGPGQWETRDVTVAFECSDSLSGVVSGPVSQTVNSEGANQSATGTCTDKAGNSTNAAFNGINIDRTSPQSQASLTEAAEGIPQVALSATDALSGVSGIHYRVDLGPDTLYSGPFTVEAPGAHEIRFRASDKAGNSDEEKSLTFSKPALTAPINDAIVADNPPVLTWEAVPGATLYDVEWSQGPTFPDPSTQRASTNSTSFTPTTPLTAGRWFWRVKAEIPGGQSFYSADFFQVAPAPPAAQPRSGDLDGDGKVSVSEATLALRVAVGLIEATPDQLLIFDINGDGKVNVQDVTLMVRAAVGLIHFPR